MMFWIWGGVKPVAAIVVAAGTVGGRPGSQQGDPRATRRAHKADAAARAGYFGHTGSTGLAARIRSEHEASVAALKRGLEHAINAGRMLVEAKTYLPHGAWLPWLHEHCGIPARTCTAYMQLARHAAETKSASFADLAEQLPDDLVR
jgi:hypothetical protein